MKKTGLIALAVVLALGAMGVGLAFWNETLTITGTVATGELDVQFSAQKSNDDGSQLDPSEGGSWTGTTDPNNTADWTWTGTRYLYNVGSTTCELTRVGGVADGEVGDNGMNTMTITIDNAYPCYYGNVAFTIDNIGSIPVHIESIKLVEISKDGQTYTLTVPRDLVVCQTWYIDWGPPPSVDNTLDPGDDFSIHLSGDLEVCKTIEVGGAMFGDICVHVEEGAEESTTYDFSIEIVVTQFNATP